MHHTRKIGGIKRDFLGSEEKLYGVKESPGTPQWLGVKAPMRMRGSRSDVMAEISSAFRG